MTKENKDYLEQLRKKYEGPDPSELKLQKIQMLDNSVEAAGTISALCTGIPGMLIFGLGMCFVTIWNHLIPGIILGLAGMAVMALALPVRNRVMSDRKKKVQAEILELSSQLL